MKRITAALLFVFLAMPLAAAEVKKSPKPDYDASDFYLRVITPPGKKTPRTLETVIAKFAGKDGLTVDLVAAVHVGDKKYYEKLNEQFKKYDVVLYELVADEGHPVDKESFTQRDGNVLSIFQEGMAEMLKLEHQLHHVDYTADNFVHADLAPEEFFKRFSERGDLLQTLMRAILISLKKQGDEKAMQKEMYAQGRFLGAMMASDPSRPLKRTLASMMSDQMRDGTWMIGGDGSAIITDRNAACLDVLRKTIREGKKRIAIFYGGAHLPEFAKSLEKEFKLHYVESDWLVAWDMN